MALYHLQENLERYDKKLMVTVTKTGTDAAKTASKRVAQKKAEARGDLVGNKVTDKIFSVGKTKSKEKEDKTNKRQDIYIPPENRQQINDHLRLFEHHIKLEYQKITNLLDTRFDNVPTFITKKWIEVHHQSNSAQEIFKPSKQIRFKTSMLRSDLCGYSDAYIVTDPYIVKLLLLQIQIIMRMIKNLLLKIMHPLLAAF